MSVKKGCRSENSDRSSAKHVSRDNNQAYGLGRVLESEVPIVREVVSRGWPDEGAALWHIGMLCVMASGTEQERAAGPCRDGGVTASVPDRDSMAESAETVRTVEGGPHPVQPMGQERGLGEGLQGADGWRRQQVHDD